MSARSTSTHPAQICSLSQNSVPANRLRKGWSSRTCSAHLHTALTNCKRANFSLLVCKHVVKGLIGGYVGASSVAEAEFCPYGNIGQVVKAVIALNINDEKISHGSQLRLTVAQGEWTDPREIEGPSTLRHPHAPSHSGWTTVLCDCANQLLGWDTSSVARSRYRPLAEMHAILKTASQCPPEKHALRCLVWRAFQCN